MSHRPRGARLTAYAALTTLALTGSLVASPAQAVPDPTGVEDASGWLAGQLTNGVLVNEQFGSDDFGLSIDAGMSFIAVGEQPSAVTAIRNALATGVSSGDYITGEAFGDTGSTYAGPVAKTAVYARAAGGNPTNFGGQNLITRLQAQVIDSGPSAGRIEDTSTFGDFANVTGQGLAARALAEASSPDTDAALDYLLLQQCPGGGFRQSFTSSKTAAQQGCTDDAQAETDATSQTLIELQASQTLADAAPGEIAAARRWLLAQQRGDGSWGAAEEQTASNANSTGLALAALDGATCLPGAPYLLGLQVPDGTTGGLAGQEGAVAYRADAYALGETEGIVATTSDQWRRATAQAVLGLAYLEADTTGAAPTLTAPSGYQRAGSTVSLQVGALAAGEKVCVRGPGARQSATSTGTTLSVPVTLLPGTGTRTYRVVTGDGDSAVASLQALGSTRFQASINKARAKRDSFVRVTVRGLASREKVQLRYAQKVIRTGQANVRGVYAASFRVGSTVGVRRLVVAGEFPALRQGADTVRVVR